MPSLMPSLISSSASVLRLATIAVAAQLFVVIPAHAQLGKLKKMGGDMIKDAAGVKTETKPDAKTAAKAEMKPVAGEDYTVTAARIDGVLTAIAPLVASGKAQAAANAQRAEYETRVKTFEKCVSDAVNAGTMPTAANLEKTVALQNRVTALSSRVESYGATRSRASLATADSMRVLTTQLSGTVMGASCGTGPFKPIALIDVELMRTNGGDMDEKGNPVTQLEVPASARMGLSPRQFGMLRERIALYTLLKAGASNATGATATFTADEKAALDARSAELSKLMPLFRDGLVRWATWNDVKSW